jgi:shikimate kinase
MTRKAEAIAHGAATIVNAIALGKGAAFGVNLWTKAEVKLTSEPHIITGEIISDPTESTTLIERTVLRVLGHFGAENLFGAKVKTESNIPVARGLKSSSSAANAIALATVAALGSKLDDLTIVNLGVEAAFDAQVTITGAFDDACASYFGGAVITNNINREIVRSKTITEDVAVLFHVPSRKAYTRDSDTDRLRTKIKPLVKIAYEEANKGNFWTALTLNGLIYSSALGYNTSVVADALAAGALAAGLSGKGPAVTVIVHDEKIDTVRAALQSHEGMIIHSQINHEKARVL